MSDFRKTSPAVLLAVMSAVSHMSNVMQQEIQARSIKTKPESVWSASRSLALLSESNLQSVVKSLPKELNLDGAKVRTLLAADRDSSSINWSAGCYPNCYVNCHGNRSWR